MAKKKKKQSKQPPLPAGGTARAKGTPKGKGYTPPKGGATPKRDGAPARPAARRGSRLSPTAQWALLVGGIGAIVAVVVILAVSGGSGGTGVTTSEAWDLPALDESLDDDGDGRVTLAEFEGTPTVVNFFASWCTACDRELPAFRELARQYEGEVDFVFVNSNETGNWRPMAESHDITDSPLVKDIGGTQRNGLYRSLGGTGGMPITGFYDADGNFLRINIGEMTFSSATQLMVELGMISPERAGLS